MQVELTIYIKYYNTISICIAVGVGIVCGGWACGASGL